LPRISSDSAREKKHQNFRSGLRRMQRRAIFFQRAQFYNICWRRIQRARGKKAVILALRYFSAAPLKMLLSQYLVHLIGVFDPHASRACYASLGPPIQLNQRPTDLQAVARQAII
jgi:hypothetical protein